LNVHICQAAAANVPALAELAATTYTDAFGHSFSPEDLAAHLAQNLSAAQVARYVAEDVVLLAEITDGAAIAGLAGTTPLAENARGRLAGYVQFGAAGAGYAAQDAAPNARLCAGDQELRRLYVASEFQGRGIGTQLLQAALAHPQMAAAGAICLDVWEHNPGAIRLYARHGFEVIGTRSFAVASGAPTSQDLIMVRKS
jgi:ribosomal protein S18 acetylase RimI-like enzyme